MDGPSPKWKLLGPYLAYGDESPLPEKPPEAIRFVCHSDTHSRTHLPEYPSIPPGDVFIHCGDFTQDSRGPEFEKFISFLGALQHPTKIVIGGNHDTVLDPVYYQAHWNKLMGHKTALNAQEIKEQLKAACIYLEDEAVEIHGIHIYGSPWTLGQWVFGYKQSNGPNIWNKIPKNTNLLVTHSPPFAILDECMSSHLGCPDLLKRVQIVQPLVHVFGHVHEQRGTTTDGNTTFINCAAVNKFRKPKNLPVVFDFVKS